MMYSYVLVLSTPTHLLSFADGCLMLMAPLSPCSGAKSCRCKMSQCLKLYCDCFAAERYCGACSCVACHNRPEYADRVQQRREDVAARNPQVRKRIKRMGKEGLKRGYTKRSRRRVCPGLGSCELAVGSQVVTAVYRYDRWGGHDVPDVFVLTLRGLYFPTGLLRHGPPGFHPKDPACA